MKGRILTAAQLEQAGAGEDQVEVFREAFGESVPVTVELTESVADRFAFYWAARSFLSAPAWAEYQRACDSAGTEYLRVRNAALAEYERVRDSARKKYDRVRDVAWKQYERALAREFARLYLQDGEKS